MLSDKMINKRLFVLMVLIFTMLIIPASFASDNISDVNTISLNQSSDISQIDIDDSGSLGDSENSTDGNSLSVVYVNAEGDDDGDGSQAKPFKTINQGLSALADNGTLMLEGTFKGIGNTNLTVNNTITMVGTNNAVIDGENNNWLLNVKNGISIYNLTFTNAYSIINSGAAISATTGTITLANVTFSNNYAFKKSFTKLYGGAIYNEKGSVVVGDNTKFINNTAENYGGAIYAKSGNILISGNNVLFDSNRGYYAGAIYGLYINITGNNIKFVNNNATYSSGSGGAIYATKDVNVLSNGVIFDKNNAYSGGAIYTSSSARVYIYANNTIFTNNNARSSYGGAVYGYYGITIVGNNNKFINNTAKNGGGALYVSSGSANVAGNNTLFENNKVTGGTSYSNGGGAVKAGSIYVSGDNTKFINNSAVYGGAILASSSGSSYIISISGKNTQFINNTASTSGGAIYSKAKLAIFNTVFDGNNGKDSAIYLSAAGNINYCVFTGNIGTYTITAFTSPSNNFDNNWWGNSTPDFTKLININSPSSYATLNLTVAKSILEQGESTVLDINAYWNGTTSQDNIGNIPFDKVYLNTTGGSIKETEGNLVDGKFSTEFVSNTIGNFTITSKLGDEVQTVNITVKGPSGTVLYVSKTGNDDNDGLTRVNPLLTINKAIEIANNNKNITKIMVNDGVYDTSELNVALALAIVGQSQNGTILKGNGKQIFVFTSDAKVNLTSLTLRNAAGNFGGAISNNGTLIITDCAFINNTALTNAGAIDNRGTLTVISSLFANNTASNDAGAISSTSSVSLTINNSTFINNTATRNGGAIRVQRSQATITNSIFDSNVALGDSGKSYGGAVYGWGANVSIYNSTLTNNNIKSNGKGGAIFAGGADNTFKASGLTITNNSAVTAGAVYFEEIGGSLTNSIILDNAGNYAVDGSGSATVNNNWWGNTNTNTTFNTNLVNGISTPTEWVILNVSASAKDIYVKDNVDVTIDLSKTQLGNTVNIPGSFLVTITTNTGKVNTTTANLVNGTAAVKYTAVSDGNDTLFVDLDGVKTSVDFNISAIPHIIYVDAVNGNDTNGGNSWETAIKTIKHALTLLNEDKDTIYIANGTYNENSLEITKSVSIVGFGNVTIDANNLGRIFAVTTDDLDVKFKNINFVNGNITGMSFGGAIYFSSSYKAINSTASIDNCTFKNSYSAAFGGAIHNGGYNLTINNSVFIRNAALYSGAICAMGGKTIILNSIFDSNFVGDASSGNWGGAIKIQSGSVSVFNSVFRNNTAVNGSAIYALASTTGLVVNYCIFEDYPTNISLIEYSNTKITADVNYNYFGNNTVPSNLISGKVNTTYWTILTVTPATDKIVENEKVKLNIDFTKFTDGKNNYTLKEAMPNLTVTLTPTIGSIRPETVVCENGIASVNYTSSIAGKEIIYINAPKQVGTLEFNVLNKELDTIYVSVDGNDSNTGSKDSPLKTLAAAIAKNHDLGGEKTIYLINGTYSASDLNIADKVTIVGEANGKVTISSQANAITINSNIQVTMMNLTFVNADNAIVNNGDLLIETSTFANNKIAIVNNGTLNVKQSVFNNNTRAISSTVGNVVVSNSKFINNTEYGIYVENTTLSLSNNAMEDNAANIYVKSGSIISNIQLVFLNNETMNVENNKSFVIGATVSDDAGNSISGGNITFTANGNKLGTADIINGIANYTITNIAGGIYTISGTTSLGTNLNIKTGTLNVFAAKWFIGNVGYGTLASAVGAAKDGDVIEGLPGTYKYTKPVEINKNITIKNRGSGEVILDASDIKDNYVVYQIGTEYINNVLRISQRNVSVNLYNLTFTNAYNQGHGGAIYSHGVLSIYNCTFANNTVVGDPDLDFNYGGAAVFNYNGQLTIRDSYFVNNTGYEGGAIYAAADSDVVAVLDINNSKFVNNKATTVNDAGGAIYAGNYLNLLVNNTEFIGNSAPTKHSTYISGGTGGAIYIRSDIESLVENSKFVNNSAFYWGGAIKAYASKLNVTNCNFTGNYAGASGGAMHFSRSADASDVLSNNINNCTFNNNDAGSIISAGGSSNRGGAICVEGIIGVYNSIFYKNTAVDGGAIYAGFVNNRIDNCTFIANSAVNGGAINNYHDSINVSNSYFERNVASYGGAIANYQTYGYANLLNNTYVENNASYGGAIYSTKSINAKTADILYSEFVNNSASVDGNEIYVVGNANINYNAFINTISANISDIYVDAKSVDYVSLENNWWGTSNPNWDEILSDTNVSAPKAYAVLNATLNESGNDTYDLIVNMYWNGTTSQANIANIPARLVKLNATGGSFSVDEGKFANGVFKSLFFTGDDKNYIIGVKVDNELIKLNLTVFKPTSVNVTINKGDDPRDNIISVVVTPDKATGNVTIDIDGKKSVVNLTDGKASITLSNLTTGEHTLTVTYNGDKNYDSSNITVKFNETFSPIVDLTVPDLEKYFGGLEKLEAILKDNLGNPIANGTIIFTINGRDTIKYTNENGSAFININLVPGEYNASVKFNGTDLYNPMAVNSTVVVKSTTIGHDIVKMFRNSTQYTALFLDGEGNPLVNTTVQFNINGVLYNRTTNTKGIATLNIQLLPNNYTITNYNPVTGEENSNKVVVKSLIVDNKDLTKYYLNGSQYTIKVFGKDGNVAANQEVTFNINGVFYKRVTDGNGMVSLNINLRPGEYVVTAEYEGCSVSNNIKVLPTLITKDIDMSCCDGSKFTAQTLDGQGNPLANQNIKFNINGVFYYKTTGANGIAELNINLNPGKYIITSIWNDYQVGNHITIK